MFGEEKESRRGGKDVHILKYNQISEFPPRILPIKGGVLHDELDDILRRNGRLRKMH
jgi:hypothetical protein